MMAVIICERMKWTYQEWLDAPSRFLTAIIEMIRAEDTEKQRQRDKK